LIHSFIHPVVTSFYFLSFFIFYLFFCGSICREDIGPPDITAVDFRTIDLKFFLQNFSLYFRIIKDNKLI
jgi:hypothetical protein